jgi:type IX secretion system PorP/SprF family membrane protein
MKKFNLQLFLFCVLFVIGFNSGQAQQLPDFTGYPSLLYQLNPAYTGTKGTIDARIAYRRQWTGFENAPITQLVSINSRLWKGRIGVGGTYYKDETGPIQKINYSAMAAIHLRFPDVELSAGFSMHFDKQFFNGSMVTTHWVGDPTVNYTLSDFDKTRNASGGLLLYNDRFHFGLGATQFMDNSAEFYLNDTLKKAKIGAKPHYYFTCGYNFNGHPDFVWENNLMAIYVDGLPMTINYNLRLHIREKLMTGVSWRLKDAVALQLGYILWEKVQITYSYDLGISRLRKGHNGSHEMMLAYKFYYNKKKNGYKNGGDFQHQKYRLF